MAIPEVVAVPSDGHPTVGGGAAVYIFPLTVPTLLPVSVYVQPGPASWNPVTKVEAAVVPRSPFTTVLIPWFVAPALPPKDPKVTVTPRFGPTGPTEAPVVKLHGFGFVPATSARPVTSVAAFVIVAVYCVLAVRFAAGVKVATWLTES